LARSARNGPGGIGFMRLASLLDSPGYLCYAATE
jgi:hypothetical protein